MTARTPCPPGRLDRSAAVPQVARHVLGLEPGLAAAVDLDRRTPLELAVRAGHDAVADVLLAAGARAPRSRPTFPVAARAGPRRGRRSI